MCAPQLFPKTFLRSAPQARAGRRSGAEAGPARACGRVEHIYTPARARDAAGAAAPSQRSSRAPALDLMPPRLGETGVPRSDPVVLIGWS